MERMNPEQGEGGPSLEASGDWKVGSLGVWEEGTRGGRWPPGLDFMPPVASGRTEAEAPIFGHLM